MRELFRYINRDTGFYASSIIYFKILLYLVQIYPCSEIFAKFVDIFFLFFYSNGLLEIILKITALYKDVFLYDQGLEEVRPRKRKKRSRRSQIISFYIFEQIQF